MTSYVFHILMGFPSSGKTHFANGATEMDWAYFDKTFYHLYRPECITINAHIDEQFEISELMNDRKYGSFGARVNEINVYLNGRYYTKEDAKTLMCACLRNIKKRGAKKNKDKVYFITHIFGPDRETCLHNHKLLLKYRRNISLSDLSDIENHPFDIVDENVMKEMMTGCESGFNVEYKTIHHDVEKLSAYDVVFKPIMNAVGSMVQNQQGNADTLYSDEWCLGGTACNYDDQCHIVDADLPKEFIELDDFFERVCPNILWKDYRELKKETVEIRERKEEDYYGGCCTYAYYACDMRKLYDMMVKLGLIDGD